PRRAARDVRLGADARDARPGATDGAGVERERDLRDTRGVRDSVRRAAETVRLVQLHVQVIGRADVPPSVESHQPEVELHATVLDDAATSGPEVNGVNPAILLLVMARTTVGRQAHLGVVLVDAAGGGDRSVALHETRR